MLSSGQAANSHAGGILITDDPSEQIIASCVQEIVFTCGVDEVFDTCRPSRNPSTPTATRVSNKRENAS